MPQALETTLQFTPGGHSPRPTKSLGLRNIPQAAPDGYVSRPAKHLYAHLLGLRNHLQAAPGRHTPRLPESSYGCACSQSNSSMTWTQVRQTQRWLNCCVHAHTPDLRNSPASLPLVKPHYCHHKLSQPRPVRNSQTPLVWNTAKEATQIPHYCIH